MSSRTAVKSPLVLMMGFEARRQWRVKWLEVKANHQNKEAKEVAFGSEAEES